MCHWPEKNIEICHKKSYPTVGFFETLVGWDPKKFQCDNIANCNAMLLKINYTETYCNELNTFTNAA